MHQNIVFVWVWWAGLSALAQLFFDLWYTNIIWIDSNDSELTTKLTDLGLRIIIGHGTYTVQQDDIVIYSDAAAESPEVLAAHEKVTNSHKRVFPPLTYFQFLGEISKYMKTIAVAGTHGKSTTTALLGTALAAHHPDFGLAIVGAPVNQRDHKNYTINPKISHDIKTIIDHILLPKGQPEIYTITKKYLFAIEADEYNHHFLHLDPDYAIITNIELDHADVYGTFENYLDTFIQFAHKVKQNIFVLPEAPGISSFMKQICVRAPREALLQSSTKIILSQPHTFVFTHLLGSHNHANASLALACTEYLLDETMNPSSENNRHPACPERSVSSGEWSEWMQWTNEIEGSPEHHSKDIKRTLSTFAGLRRRGELLWHNSHEVPIITDYGHHPTELASTLQALREKYKDTPITCIFQPHQARRVMEFRDEFTTTLQQFDTTLIYDIYAARENLEDLKQQYQKSKKDSHCEPSEVEVWQSPNFSDLTSIHELWTLFATASNATYTTDFSDIQHTLDTTTEGVIVIFTAGDLDWKVRKYLFQ